MAFKFVVLSALLAVASAGVLAPVTYAASPLLTKVADPAVDAVATTHEHVVRSFDGTVSQYSKAIETPYSSVRKEDTRISNNVYTPAIAKTIAYAAPAPTAAYYTHAAPVHHKHVFAPAETVYEHHESVPTATVYTHSAPAHKTVTYSAPAAVYAHSAPVHKTVTYSAPAAVIAKQVAYAAPAVVHKPVAYAAPAVVHKPVAYAAAPVTTTYNHGPAATTYAHSAPGVSAYGSAQTVHYSPAMEVSHMSFDGFGTHWGWGN